MDEGIVEGSEDAGHAKDEFTCNYVNWIREPPATTHLHELEVQGRCSRWRHARPSSWEASCDVRDVYKRGVDINVSD